MSDFFAYLPIEPGTRDFIRMIESDLDKDLMFKTIAKMRIGGLDEDRLNELFSILNNIEEEVRRNKEENLILNLILGEQNEGFFRGARLLRLTDLLDEIGIQKITSPEWARIHRAVRRKLEQEEPAECWFPNCTSNPRSIIASHSLQRGKWLTYIQDQTNQQVWSLPMYKKSSQNEIDVQSTFLGFCDLHDRSTFLPIEKPIHCWTAEEYFLFAYRAFVHTGHMLRKYEKIQKIKKDFKREVTLNKKLFDTALTSRNYSKIITHELRLGRYCPVAATGAFPLYFDFLANEIPQDKNRLSKIFLSVLPDLPNKDTIILISYFQEDKTKYNDLVHQMILRGRVEQDISTLVVGLMDNVFFNPIYYLQIIENQTKNCFRLIENMPQDYMLFASNEVQLDVDPNYLFNPPAKVNIFATIFSLRALSPPACFESAG